MVSIGLWFTNSEKAWVAAVLGGKYNQKFETLHLILPKLLIFLDPVSDPTVTKYHKKFRNLK